MININGKEWALLEATDIQETFSEHDFDESFYFEFKDDRVTTQKLIKEVSAFANTFGGYIFIGISDDKKIEGCTAWNEQRIHTTIHDSISPTPSFDVKKFTCNTKVVYIIKIDEGAEPPYVTNEERIYERLSSGSLPIKDSVRLSQIYSKREQYLSKLEQKIAIPPIPKESNNIYGYIDTGFALNFSDSRLAIDTFNKVDLKIVVEKMIAKMDGHSLAFVGNSIIFIAGGLSTTSGQLPAHTNNFLEIMADGSAKMRILLINNDQNNPTINMMYSSVLLKMYKDVYTCVFGELFPDKMIYAKKYESLTVCKQFQPTLFYDNEMLKLLPDCKEQNDKMLAARQRNQEVLGIDTIVTDDRIPKTGLYTIDKQQMEKWGVDYTTEGIIDELFYSRFVGIGVKQIIENGEDDTEQ